MHAQVVKSVAVNETSRYRLAALADPANAEWRMIERLMVADPDGRIAEIYREIARKVAIHIAERARDMTSKFPSIVVQNT